MITIVLAIVLLAPLAWLAQVLRFRRRRERRLRERADRQRRRVLHWQFLDRLFRARPKQLTYRERDELAD